ncbi:hypothetical protein O1L44_00745 [Streptomyces noursei]|nr:hypothetical protein [Streptomyces noursei]
MNAVEEAGLGSESGLGEAVGGCRRGAEAFDGDVALLVVERGEESAQRGQCVRGGSAVDAGVHAALQGAEFHHAGGDPAQTGCEAGRAGGQVVGVSEHDDVGVEFVLVAVEEGAEVR